MSWFQILLRQKEREWIWMLKFWNKILNIPEENKSVLFKRYIDTAALAAATVLPTEAVLTGWCLGARGLAPLTLKRRLHEEIWHHLSKHHHLHSGSSRTSVLQLYLAAKPAKNRIRRKKSPKSQECIFKKAICHLKWHSQQALWHLDSVLAWSPSSKVIPASWSGHYRCLSECSIDSP